MSLEKEVNFSDEGADGSHVLGSIFGCLLSVLCPPIGIPLLVNEYKKGKKLSSGKMVTAEESALDEMTTDIEDRLAREFEKNHISGEETLLITNSTQIPPDPDRNYGLFYIPGKVTKTSTYKLRSENQ